MGEICADCGVDTTPKNERGEPVDGAWEWYMVKNDVWEAAGMKADRQMTGEATGILCIGCLEQRLRRKLTVDDFTNFAVNFAPSPLSTRRLRDRLTNG